MRNPKWHRDEIILALELYFRTESGQIHANNPEIVELSKILNKLPIHKERPDLVKFRNPNGVSLKLSNFLAIDPNYYGKGMQSFSQLDEKVFNEFVDNKNDLIRIAGQIKKTSNDKELSLQLYRIEDELDDIEVKEGKVIYKLHKHYERNSKINKKKKKLVFKKFGELKCEVCNFDFYQKYGNLGKGFIECHHRKPLFEIQKETQTKIEDLALVCSNCHRMLHRNLDTMSVQDLRKLIN